MGNAYWKDIWRSISKGKKRFISIAVIAALGVTMMCGLRAACEDLRYSADFFFDEQNLFDIQILSTLGLTEEDLEVLDSVDSVELADGGYNETVYTLLDGVRKSIDVRTLSTKGMNQPYLLEGRMPEKANEIVITENYKKHSGKDIGDEILLDEESEVLKSRTFTITGTIVDALDINSSEGSMGFRSTATTDYVGYVTEDAVDSDIYTVIYLKLDGLEELNCYSDEYTDKVEQIVDEIESTIKEKREQSRYDEIYTEAMEEWQDGEREMKEEFVKADSEIADAKQEIADARKKIEDGWKELEDGKQALIDGEAELNSQAALAETEFANARALIADGYAQIAEGEAELEQAYIKLVEGQAMLDVGKAELSAYEAAALQQIAEGRQVLADNEAQLNAGFEAYEAGRGQFEEMKAQYQPQIDAIKAALENPELTEEAAAQLEEQLALIEAHLAEAEQELNTSYAELEAGKAQIEVGKAELDAQEAAAQQQIAAAWAAINGQQAEIDSGILQYQEGIAALQTAKEQLAAGEAELNAQEASARQQIADGRAEIVNGWIELQEGEQELLDGEEELADGEQELAENIAEYEEEKAKAEQELADALEEINDIEMTRWYVQDRTSLSGYSNIKSDADSIQAIGNVFPVLFLTVAILISLTTITRLVEEERGLIGTYKALGFTNTEIRRKYLIYAALACLVGGIIGDIGGYVILPFNIFIVFHVMYVLPQYWMQFDFLYGLGGILLFEVGIVGATVFASSKALKQMPAKLMRPKAPKSGSRVLLERITFLWKRFSFLNKVTARNLFRYKKRLLMTVFGIAGCTALLLCGFTIKDTITEMMPQQYERIYQYDLMVVSSAEDYEEVQDILNKDEKIENYIPAGIESVELINSEGKEETVQLIVVPDGSTLETYINLKNEDGQAVELKDDSILLTKNATRILGIGIGDSVTMQTLDLEEAEVMVTEIVENYFGNVIYMTEESYCRMFEEFEINGALVHFSEACEDQKAYTDELERQESILSAVSTQAMKDEFSSAFALINMVVYVVLVLAAMLAFVVLFTLSNTNISERERELATIKVLGFYDHEVHSYVNKETWILTSIGILAGMPTGWLLGRYVMGILEFPSLEFYIDLYPQSYLYAAAITLIFAFVVNFITDRTLNKINMVEALKSVE
ncbi:MAG: hypothetical protein J5983_03245 [Ruminococcus sp.]|nr:hypothetical protein [Ruminococcus sp.]